MKNKYVKNIWPQSCKHPSVQNYVVLHLGLARSSLTGRFRQCGTHRAQLDQLRRVDFAGPPRGPHPTQAHIELNSRIQRRVLNLKNKYVINIWPRSRKPPYVQNYVVLHLKLARGSLTGRFRQCGTHPAQLRQLRRMESTGPPRGPHTPARI